MHTFPSPPVQFNPTIRFNLASTTSSWIINSKGKKMGICKFPNFSFLFFLMLLLFKIIKGQNTQSGFDHDRASLLWFMSGIISDPHQSLKNWNSTEIHFCNWVGIKCDHSHGKYRVTEVDLSGRSLTGIISPAIANLSALTVLDLAGNFFHGGIPPEIGSISTLTQLSLSSNLLQGKIPSQIGNLHQLVYLSLGSNKLTGEIPKTLFCNGSSYFQYIDFSNNTLNGEIPLNNQCQLKQLRFLLLWSNHLTGQIPKALSNSSNLQWLDLESNFLSGELPAEVVNKMPRLQILYLSYNNFESYDLDPFFLSLTNCSNLKELELAGNSLRGQLPPSIGSLSSSNLKEIHLHDNLIYGPIPPQISNLFNLSLLNLSNNFLNGSIPSDLSRMKKLERLYLSNNSLSGEIPASLGEIHHLGLLDLSKNMLTGQIPDSFVNVSQLRSLLLHENQLSGTIPSSLGKCINLEILDLSHNRISGEIPREVILGLSSLKMYLNLSNNQLEGTIPLELSKMDMVLSIDLSSNKLSKTIPPQLGSCVALESLNISNNMLEGSLPESIRTLPYLKELDVSSNQLTGSLCGSKMCRNRKKTHHVLVLPVVITFVFMLIVCALVGYYLSLKSKFDRKGFEDKEKGGESIEHKYPRISHRQLIEATDGFSGSSLVGSGSYGHVYKGTLKDSTRIAVKVLNSNTTGEISGSFKRECQVLKRARHRNLIRILTICSRPDFKALVFPLMSNGSLEDHLYPRTEDGLGQRLDLAQLVSICSDVSEGLAYLHHHSPVRVVHCDLKPSNILLDDDMMALVTDFGIARLVKGEEDGGDEDENVINSSDGLLCGTVGYIAPEYGVGRKASIEGDVYSFGILTLEIITGKRPTDVIFHQGSTLHDWVQSHYPDRVEPLVEEVLERCRPHPNQAYDINVWRDVVIELIDVGLVCTEYSSVTRPTMLDVAQEMVRLKSYISTTSTLVGDNI